MAPDPKAPSGLASSQHLVGAQAALEAILSKTGSIKEILAHYGVWQEDYFVQAGFNEDLLCVGAGHLEEIYVSIGIDLDDQEQSDMPQILVELGNLLAPFPCVLSTPNKTYHTPPPQGSELGFDSVILHSADQSSHFPILKLTNHMEEAENVRQNEGGGTGGGSNNSGQNNGPPSSQGHRDRGLPNGDRPGGHARGPGGGRQGSSHRDKDKPSSSEIRDGSSLDGGGEPGGTHGEESTEIPEVACHSHVAIYCPLANPVESPSTPLSKVSPPQLLQKTLFQEFIHKPFLFLRYSIPYNDYELTSKCL